MGMNLSDLANGVDFDVGLGLGMEDCGDKSHSEREQQS